MAGKTTYQRVREEDRRAKISISKHLTKLTDIQKELEKDSKDMNVPALRLRADISLSLLKKRLPDLKAIEHSGSVGEKPLEEMTDGELSGELVKIRELINGSTKKAAGKDKSSSVH